MLVVDITDELVLSRRRIAHVPLGDVVPLIRAQSVPPSVQMPKPASKLLELTVVTVQGVTHGAHEPPQSMPVSFPF